MLMTHTHRALLLGADLSARCYVCGESTDSPQTAMSWYGSHLSSEWRSTEGEASERALARWEEIERATSLREKYRRALDDVTQAVFDGRLEGLIGRPMKDYGQKVESVTVNVDGTATIRMRWPSRSWDGPDFEDFTGPSTFIEPFFERVS